MSLPELQSGVGAALADKPRQDEIKRDRLLRLKQVLGIVAIGKSAWYGLIAEGRAPPSVLISSRTVGWSERAVMAFVQARLEGVDWKPAVTKTNEVLQ